MELSGASLNLLMSVADISEDLVGILEPDCVVSVDPIRGGSDRSQSPLSQVLHPVVQIAASVPVTALFTVLLLALSQLAGELQIGSVILMMLGTM